MRTIEAVTRVEVLDEKACLELLRNDDIGRLGVVAGGAPHVVPINYAVDGEMIIFRSGAGTKLSAAERAPVCLEIDEFDRNDHTGWSVLVVGRLEEITEHQSALLARLQTLPVDPWAGGDKSHWMRLVPARITGRRVVRDATS